MKDIESLISRIEYLEERVKYLEKENIETTNVLYELMNRYESIITSDN